MRRASKRKSDNSTSAKSSNVDSVRSTKQSAPKKPTKEVERIDNLFDKYANKPLGVIEFPCMKGAKIITKTTGPEGIEALCKDLGVDHTDVRMLMFAWKLNAAKQGYFTQEEWERGLKDLKADTIAKLKKKLSELEKEARKPENFEDFYLYAFRYCLTEEKQKCIDIETSCILLDIVLSSQYRSQVDSFTKYLKIQSEYKAVNMDQWLNFFRFCAEISFPNLENYDTLQAWPLILDNFVEWMRGENQSSVA